MRGLNLQSYWLSIPWPRVRASGSGSANQAGPDFCRRLTDELLSANIRPLPTLRHWDLPEALEDASGSPNRDTAC